MSSQYGTPNLERNRWALCPSPESTDVIQREGILIAPGPQPFSSTADPRYQELSWLHSFSWTSLPVMWLDEQDGSPYGGHTLRDYLPPSTIRARFADLKTEISDAVDGRAPEPTCELGSDWHFDRLALHASASGGYKFEGFRIESFRQSLLRMAYELEDELRREHPALSASAIASFWTSWSVWKHLAVWGRRLDQEIRSQESAESSPLANGYGMIADGPAFVYRQLIAYAKEACAWSQPTSRDHKRAGPQLPAGAVSPIPKRQRGQSLSIPEVESTLGNLSTVTVQVAADVIGCTPRTIHNLVRAGSLTRNRTRRITTASIRSHLGIPPKKA